MCMVCLRIQPSSVCSEFHLAEFKWIQSASLCSRRLNTSGDKTTILILQFYSASSCSDPEGTEQGNVLKCCCNSCDKSFLILFWDVREMNI